MATIQDTVQKLSRISAEKIWNPYTDVSWPETWDPDTWYFAPELVSLYRTPEYEQLDEPARKRLAFYEAVNFFSLNIHGERSLMEGLSHRLYNRENTAISDYLHHFLDEENRHMVLFCGFCMRYATKVYPEKKLAFPRDYAPGEEEFLFFAKVLIFEEIVDYYNVKMAQDMRLPEIARLINSTHHLDEARHLVFGREWVAELFGRHRREWPEEVLRGIREYLCNYFVMTWHEYYNPDVYRDAGFEKPYEVMQAAWNHPVAKVHRKTVSRRCLDYLLTHEILAEEPDL